MIKGFKSGIKGKLGVESEESSIFNYIMETHFSQFYRKDKWSVNFVNAMKFSMDPTNSPHFVLKIFAK